jgi:hypothetical protein
VSPRQAAAGQRLAEAAAWPAWPGDEHIVASQQFLWAMPELHKKGLLALAVWAVDPLVTCDHQAWDRLADELLERVPRGAISRPLANYLTVRLVERCPDMTRWPKAVALVRLALGGDHIAGRQIGRRPGAIMHAARYYYHYKRLGIAVGVREIAKHAGVSHGLAARWVARWRNG